MDIKEKFLELKGSAGSHSPSIQTIISEIPELSIKVDACFLSNPYATELFMSYLNEELISTGHIHRILEFYPSQNAELAKVLGEYIQVPAGNIFVANGAIEAIQAIIHNFVKGKVVVNIPTFSAYYEYVLDDSDVLLFQLDKRSDFHLNIEEYLEFINENDAKSVVIINPNNPDGGYIKREDLLYLCSQLKHLDNIIIDESFIHFAYEDDQMEMKSIVEEVLNFPNIILIKSMSKDFGVAGLRCGYAIMSKEHVSKLTSKGYLWNVSGLAEYFFRLYVRTDFNKKYEEVRRRYLRESINFIDDLRGITGLKCYPTRANFILIEILDGRTSEEITMELLLRHGIYVRNCSDKKGLIGEFIRVAARSKVENIKIVRALKDIFHVDN